MVTRPTTTRYLFVILVSLVLLNILVYLRPWESNKELVDEPTIHDKGYKDARVQYIENEMVQVQIVGTKSAMVFRPDSKDLNRFRVGWLAPVTFKCGKKLNEECDLSKPFELYVSSVRVELVEMGKPPF